MDPAILSWPQRDRKAIPFCGKGVHAGMMRFAGTAVA